MSSLVGLVETRVLVGPSLHMTNSDGEHSEGCVLSLRHPKLGTPMCYVLRNGSLQEVHWFKQSHCSWFLGDFVCEDGGLYMTTPLDPIFIFLPIFEEARMQKGNNDLGMFRAIDEILFVDGYLGYQHLLPIAEDTMQLVCEVKEIGCSKFYRLDDSKVLAWLCCKVNNLRGTLSMLDKHYAAREEMETVNDAVSLMSEYVRDDWLKILCAHLKLNMDVTHRTPHNEMLLPTDEDSHPSFQNAKVGYGKKNGEKQSKKQRVQVDSKNIKGMFMRVTRKKL